MEIFRASQIESTTSIEGAFISPLRMRPIAPGVIPAIDANLRFEVPWRACSDLIRERMSW